MKLNALVTLGTGVLTSFLPDPIYYLIALIAPIIVSCIYVAITQPKGGLRM